MQIQLPANVDAQLQLLDLRGTTQPPSCAYQLYVYSQVTSRYIEWCATRGPTSAWQNTYYVHSASDGRAQTVDIVFRRQVPSASGAFWIAIEGIRAHNGITCALMSHAPIAVVVV